MLGRNIVGDLDRQMPSGLDRGFDDPFKCAHPRSEQAWVTGRKHVGEPHRFKIAAGNPISAASQLALDAIALGSKIELIPGAVDPQFVEFRPMDAGNPVGIFHADDDRGRKCIAKRTDNSDTRLRVRTAI